MLPAETTALAILAALVAAWVAGVWLSQWRRRRRLRRLAGDVGIRLAVRDPFDLPETLFSLPLFGRGHSRLARNVVHGQLEGLPVRLFDYQYETGSGKNRRTHRWQVAVVFSQHQWPGLMVQPRQRHDPLEVLFALEEVSFQVEPFAGRFQVASSDRQFAYRLLHPRLTDLLASWPNVSMETQGPSLALYEPGPCRPAEAMNLLALARGILKTVPDALAEELRDPDGS